MKKIFTFLLLVSVAFISCSSGSDDDSYIVPIVNGVLDNGTNNDPTNNPNTSPENNQENGSQQESSIGYIKVKNETTSMVYLYEDGDSFRANLKARIPAKSEYTIESKTGVVTYYYSFMIDIGGALIPWYSSDVNSFSAFSVQVSENKVATQEISFPNSMESSSSYIVLKNSGGSAIKVFKGSILLSPVDYPENMLINSGEQFVYEIKPEDYDKIYYIKNAIGTSLFEINQAVGSFEQNRIYTVEFSDSVKLIESTQFNKTKYTVEHYRESLNGEYSLYDFQEIYGIVGKKTKVLPEEYIGFESKPFEQVTLAENVSPTIKIYYARKIIRLTFNCGSGKFIDDISEETITGKYEEQVSYTKCPVREFYNFDGWEGKTEEFPSEDLTIHAKWSPVTYSISYELNGGTNAADNPSNYTVESDIITLNSPAKDGYGFEGWYDSVSFSKKVTQIQSGSNGNKKLYAKWTPIVYSISYILNGGINSQENLESYTIESDSFTLRLPTRKFYIFDGWYSESNFINKVSNVPTGSIGDMNFYAKWSPVAYSIIYYLNGGTNNISNPTYYTIESENLILQEPSRAGYEFNGWYSEDYFANEVSAIANGSNGDRNLYAKWTPIKYSITYHLDGGSNSISNSSTYTVESDTFYFSSPSKYGYSFVGWYGDVEFNKAITCIQKGAIGNKELYAKWISNSLSINVTMPENYRDIEGLSYSEENGILKLQASSGYQSYRWYFDDEIVSGNSNTCSIDVSLPSVRAGVHFAMVVVKDNSGRTYSAQMQIVVRK